MVDDPDWAPIFAPNGYLARRGDRIQRLNYSKTLRAIAEEGPDAFYMVCMVCGLFTTVDHPHPCRDPSLIVLSKRFKPQEGL